MSAKMNGKLLRCPVDEAPGFQRIDAVGFNAACNRFFHRRGMPVVNFRGEAVPEPAEDATGERRAQINAASRRHRARRKGAQA